MLSAAKSFRLPFRRSSVVKTGALSPEQNADASSSSSVIETSKRGASGNQATDNNGDVERLHAAIHRLLMQPQFARLSSGVRLAAVERVVCDLKRRQDSQRSILVSEDPSEQSDTEWEDWDHIVGAESEGDTKQSSDTFIGVEELVGMKQKIMVPAQNCSRQLSRLDTKQLERSESMHSANTATIVQSRPRDLLQVQSQDQLSSSRVGELVQKQVAEVLAVTPPLDVLSPEQLSIVCDSLQFVSQLSEDGQTIIREGEMSCSIFILLEGEVSLQPTASATSVRRAPFVHFEPPTLIASSEAPSSCTVRAVGTIKHVMLPCEALRGMLTEANELLNGLLLSPSTSSVPQTLTKHLEAVGQSSVSQVNSSNLSLWLLQASAPELNAAEVIYSSLLAVQDHVQARDAAICIVEASEPHATRWTLSQSNCTADVVPLQGITSSAVRSTSTITAHHPLQDDRYDPAIDLAVVYPDAVLVSIPVLDDTTAIVLQLTRTHELSADELLQLQSAMRSIASTLAQASHQGQYQAPETIPSSPPRLSIALGNLHVPVTASPSLTAIVPIAASVSASIFFGQELLGHAQRTVSSSTATRTIHGALLFAFHEPLLFPGITNAPRGSRLVVHVRVSPRVERATLRRRSSIFSGSGVSGRNLLEDTASSDATTIQDPNGVMVSAWGGCFLCHNEANDSVLQLWTEGEYDPVATPACGLQDLTSSVRLTIRTPSTGIIDGCASSEHGANADDAPSPDLQKLQRTLTSDVFYQLTPDDRALLWSARNRLLLHDPLMLRWLLRCVDWTDSASVREYHTLLRRCPMTDPPELALHLLGTHVADPPTRAYAVRCLASAPNTVALYALQLVHALRHEPQHDSSLARLLLCVALQSPVSTGTQLFWLLRTEMDDMVVRDRYRLLLASLLRGLPPLHRHRLLGQVRLVNHLHRIHSIVVAVPDHADRQTSLHAALEALTLPTNATLPLAPTQPLLSVLVQRCRVLSSKQKPLYLVFQLENDSLHVLFKVGDDLRQDQLVLQLFGTMNSLWRRDGLNLDLVTYGCIATSTTSGLIQVVRDAETVATIFSHRAQQQHRGSAHPKLHAALGVLTDQQHALTHWLQQHASPSYRHCVRRFAATCAASCVATYVLGIGDRHNDNIMLARDGRLFHVDFGHVFGHFKSKFGVKRERTMFVFTPAFAAVLMSDDGQPAQAKDKAFLAHLKHAKSCCSLPAASSDKDNDGDDADDQQQRPSSPRRRWQQSIHASLRLSSSASTAAETPSYELFTRLCCDGYTVVRHHAALLYDLCLLMASGGALRELRGEKDLAWLRIQLHLQDDDAQASRHLLRLLKHSVVSRATLLNDAAHLLKHG